MSIELVELVLVWAIGVLIFASALLTLVRITVGPSVLDRVVATDVLVSIVVCALGAYAAFTRLSTTLPLLVSLSLVGFLGSVAVARFVAADRDPERSVGGTGLGSADPDPEHDPVTGERVDLREDVTQGDGRRRRHGTAGDQGVGPDHGPSRTAEGRA